MSELQDNGQKVLKVDVVAQDTQENRDRIKAIESRLAELELRNAQLTERMTLFQLAQGVFTAVAASIAAFLGSR